MCVYKGNTSPRNIPWDTCVSKGFEYLVSRISIIFRYKYYILALLSARSRD